MVRTLILLTALAVATPAFAQGAPAQSWPVMGNHTLDMPAQGAHSRSRPWLKTATSPKRGARARQGA